MQLLAVLHLHCHLTETTTEKSCSHLIAVPITIIDCNSTKNACDDPIQIKVVNVTQLIVAYICSVVTQIKANPALEFILHLLLTASER